MFSLFYFAYFLSLTPQCCDAEGNHGQNAEKRSHVITLPLNKRMFISLIMKLVIADSLTERVGFKKEGKNSSNGSYALLVLFPSFVWGKIVMK